MFQTFFSAIVRNQMELASNNGSLPKTPASARRVNLSYAPAQNNVHPPDVAPLGQNQASDEQLEAIKRLENGTDPWEQLGIQQGADNEEINKTYRKLAMLLHPDKTAIHGASDAFKLLGLARRNALQL